MAKNAQQIEYRKVNDLKSYVNNPHIHPRAQRRKLKSLLRRFGQIVPIIVDPNGVAAPSTLDKGHW